MQTPCEPSVRFSEQQRSTKSNKVEMSKEHIRSWEWPRLFIWFCSQWESINRTSANFWGNLLCPASCRYSYPTPDRPVNRDLSWQHYKVC